MRTATILFSSLLALASVFALAADGEPGKVKTAVAKTMNKLRADKGPGGVPEVRLAPGPAE